MKLFKNRRKGPGPARRRAVRTSQGRREHARIYWDIISKATDLADSESAVEQVDLLASLELAVIRSTGYSNPDLYNMACRVLHEGQKLVLNNNEPQSLIQARKEYSTAASQALR
ncbi:hypothetical protein [Streptomyces sp. 5-10]|uniref:hypothetical protein n=1 Tax=Streptomyces sp. 5-10 TaxID=878925 RepID=UPI00168AA33F|nr:hypothetical protein [Streptomyces sp. 5-10]MBD3004764.1 hypothetical protein [Streptomyces sp. 5-10]